MVSKSSLRHPRAGFTLIELLVVISIIVVLISLTTSAVMKFRLTGPRLATKSNMKNMAAKLTTQRAEILGKARTENLTVQAQFALGNAGVTNLQDPNARAVYAQLKVAQAFPRSFDAVLNPPASALAPWAGYVNFLTQLGVVKGNTTAPEIQQAICLQMALSIGPSNLAVDNVSLGSTGSKLLTLGPNPNPVANPLKQSQTYGCIDAFGNPLLYDPGSSTALPIILSAGADGQYGVSTASTTNLPLPPYAPPTYPSTAVDNLTSLDP